MNKRQSLYFLFLLFISITTIFTVLTINNVFNQIDAAVQTWVTTWRTSIWIQFSEVVTSIAHSEVLGVLSFITVIVLLLSPKLIKQIPLFLILMGGSMVITFTMKITIERDRPGSIEYIDIFGIAEQIISYSYPSGHAVKGFILLGFFIYIIQRVTLNQRLRNSFTVILAVVICLIGIGQIILDKHYLSDVIGGYLVGATWFICVLCLKSEVIKWWDNNKLNYKRKDYFDI